MSEESSSLFKSFLDFRGSLELKRIKPPHTITFSPRDYEAFIREAIAEDPDVAVLHGVSLENYPNQIQFLGITIKTGEEEGLKQK
jgi:hypothetical protein